MSDNLLATVITLAILLSIFVWDPLMTIAYPAFCRLLKRPRNSPVGEESSDSSTGEPA